jgi:peptidyl-prolyl cis-trans isomerase D
MAVIQKIRNRSGLAVIIIGIAIAAFVIGDFGKQRASNVTDIGVVDGEAIPYVDFNGKVDETIRGQTVLRKSRLSASAKALSTRW